VVDRTTSHMVFACKVQWTSDEDFFFGTFVSVSHLALLGVHVTEEDGMFDFNILVRRLSRGMSIRKY